MQIEELTFNIENGKKIYLVWYFKEDGIIFQIDHFYHSDPTTAKVIYNIEKAIETNDDVYTIEDINLEVLGEIWVKYQKEQYI